MRTRVWAGNWKMNFGPAEALEYFSTIKPGPLQAGGRWVIFPPAYCLSRDIQQAAAKSKIELGAQNVHSEEKGAFTGELSGAALKATGIHWALIAHSERRQFFCETDETAAKRFERAALTGLNIIYCIGERLAERESGQTETVLTRQIQPFTEIYRKHAAARGSLVWAVAYEPVWAIGTGKTATTEQAEQAHKHIRKQLPDQDIPILYGGSVTPENCVDLMSQPNVDGVLVGGASLKPEGFSRILACP